MIELFENGGYLLNNEFVLTNQYPSADKEKDKKKTIAYGILKAHNTNGNMDKLKIRFDAMASHDITFVGIIQTSRASGMKQFPLPYVLTNCHNSLCAVGGTINEDDHLFGLTAAKKYGGIYVPPHMAVIHEYMREEMAGCGKMILGSDSHTRYGAIGTMAIGEGGGELAKQLLCDTYDVTYPNIVMVYLKGTPGHGVGPHDVALALVGAVFKNGFVKNSVLEFVGPGITNLSMDFRNGIDVMTTETTCLSSIWCTDDKTKEYLKVHNRENEYIELKPAEGAFYDKAIVIDLSTIKPMIALPMHPSNAYTIDELNENLVDILTQTEKDARALIDNPDVKLDLLSKIVNGKLQCDQGVIAGCSGGLYENIYEASQILKGKSIGSNEYVLSVYPSSMPLYIALNKAGALTELMEAGAIIRSAFCGPCFGAGDVPANGALSIRHTTRNFPSREGSKPAKGQIASVALMDARSIAATSASGGILTSAADIDYDPIAPLYTFDDKSYKSRVYKGFGNPLPETELRLGPNITDWPLMPALSKNLILKISSFIDDPVTTTDELIPSGETSSFRSNPLGLAEFTLSRKDPKYVSYAKEIRDEEYERLKGNIDSALISLVKKVPGFENITEKDLSGTDFMIESSIYARKPGDGSAREQAASCQRVLGAGANIAYEYATKRYRSNLINWGMLPFVLTGDINFTKGDYILVTDIIDSLINDKPVKAYVLKDEPVGISLLLGDLTKNEKEILKAGCLINFNKNK